MRNFIKAIVIVLFVATSSVMSGCSAFFSNLPTILAYVQDGQLILSTIESFVNSFFLLRPDTELQKKVNIAMARAKSALDAALRVATGAGKLNQAEIDAAFADFKVAYTDLINMLAPLGVSASGNTLKAVPGGLVVPAPLAFMSKV